MVQEHEIRAQLARYLSGEVSLGAFERWLNSARLPVVVDANDEAFKLVARIDLMLSERHDHIITEAEFREGLVGRE